MPKTQKPQVANKINFVLRGIDLLGVKLSPPQKDIEYQNYQFDLKIEQKYSTELKDVIGNILSVEILDQNRINNLGNFSMGCAFEFEKLDQYVDQNTKRVNLPLNIVEELNSITISTARGMMFFVFKGTILHNAMMPIVDTKSFIPIDFLEE